MKITRDDLDITLTDDELDKAYHICHKVLTKILYKI